MQNENIHDTIKHTAAINDKYQTSEATVISSPNAAVNIIDDTRLIVKSLFRC